MKNINIPPLLKCISGLLMTIFLTSCCSWTHSCGCDNDEAMDFQFNGENLEWVNYEEGDATNFSNESGDIVALKVPEIKEIIHLGDRGDECTPDKYDALNITFTFKSQSLIDIEIGGSGEINFVQSNTVGSCYISSQTCLQQNSDRFEGKFFDNLTLNGTEYEELFRVKFRGNLEEIYWAKTKGIVQFRLLAETWNLAP